MHFLNVCKPNPPSQTFLGPTSQRDFTKDGSLTPLGVIEIQPQYWEVFYSKHFLIPKKKKGWQPILDLIKMNTFINKFKFRMVTLTFIIPTLDLRDWFPSFNFPDAYSHTVITLSHKYLRPLIGHEHYQYQVLHFGLSTTEEVLPKCQQSLQHT